MEIAHYANRSASKANELMFIILRGMKIDEKKNEYIITTLLYTIA
jgi:hypothetical protein